MRWGWYLLITQYRFDDALNRRRGAIESGAGLIRARSLTTAAHPCLLRGACGRPGGGSMHAYRMHTGNALTAADVGRDALGRSVGCGMQDVAAILVITLAFPLAGAARGVVEPCWQTGGLDPKQPW